jgi:hypothetical protein
MVGTAQGAFAHPTKPYGPPNNARSASTVS